MSGRLSLWPRSWACAAVMVLGGAASGGAQVLPPVGPLSITTATAGAQPNSASGSVTYAPGLVFTGQRRVTGELNANMPANTTLSVRITGGTGGTSLGYVALNTVPRDVVVAAFQTFFVVNTIAYTFTALVTAGVVPANSRTVTFTVANWP